MHDMSPALPKWITPLSAVDSSIRDAELSQLDELVVGAMIVGLGEPTHGQKEPDQLRDRVTRYLVAHHGFRVVAIEDSAITCRLVDSFIRDGIGTGEAALRAQPFWHWRTREYMDMIMWLRDWNTSYPDDQVRLMGIDIQNLQAAAQALRQSLPCVLDAHPDLADALTYISSINIWETAPTADWPVDILLSAVDRLQTLLPEKNETHLDTINAIQEGLQLWQRVTESDPGSGKSWAERDRAMAKRVLAPTHNFEKVIVWAHNGHIQSDALDGELSVVKTMGQHLRDELYTAYVAVAGIFGQGSYLGIDPQSGQRESLDVGEPPGGTIDRDLWQINLAPALLVNIRSSDLEPTSTRMAGAALERSEDMTARVSPKLAWDAVLFVREANPSTPLTVDR